MATSPHAQDQLANLTIEEKASLTSGQDFWHTQGIDQRVPPIMMTDGPHGLRKQAGETDHLGLNASVPATCFPPAVALASTFDPELARRVGEALGTESAIEDVAVILGPGINIKRSPLCGRNFEYFSEDPIVAGALGTALVQGIQSKGVGASLKHFAANNQETDRMRISSDVDMRTLHEVYMRAFERVVKDAKPWTVMCSYNKINGVYASENPWLLTQVLREEWGFDGLVVSDWGAVNERVPGLAAGMDLEMPASGGATDAEIVAAVSDGSLDPEVLNTAATRVLDLVSRAQNRPEISGPLDVHAHHALAREVAGRSVVLLKNDDDVLPLHPDQTVALIGEFARTPRFQGGGSSHINPTQVDNALDAFTSLKGEAMEFAPGFTFDGSNAEALREEAVALASKQDVAVVFAGLPEAEESEGFDREHIDLPQVQLDLIEAVRAVNEKTVVVLSNGSVVALPFKEEVPAIVEGWLLGQAGGSAIADVLSGTVNPAGRLAETIPLRLEDTPAYGSFPGAHGHVRYAEGIYVGYRWYDFRDIDVAFPFGHGLSYTTFGYGEPNVAVYSDGDLAISLDVTNTGSRDGREVVQVYVGLPDFEVERAPRELAAFAPVDIPAGETRRVELIVRREDLAYWDERVNRFVVEGGTYRIDVGASSRDLRRQVDVEIAGDSVSLPLTLNSSIGDVLANPVVGPVLQKQMAGMMDAAGAAGTEGGASGDGGDAIMNPVAMQRMLADFPIGRLAAFGMGMDKAQLAQLIAAANGE